MFRRSPFNSREGKYEKDNITLVVDKPTKYMTVFTLYGPDIDKMVLKSISMRGIDQKSMADYATKTVFNMIFDKEIHVKFNVYETIIVDELIARLEQFLLESWTARTTLENLINELKKRKDEIIKAEIDGQLFFRGVRKKGDWVEVKLYTCPDDEPSKVLQNHLTDAQLVNYFAINKFLALMGFSYIKDPNSDDPLPYDRDGKYPDGIESIWAVNITFVNKNILKKKNKLKAADRAELIFDGVYCNLDLISDELDLESKDLFFKNTVNLVKVHQMGQIIQSYIKTTDELKNALKERDDKIKAMEQERKAMEQEKETMREAMEQEKETMEQRIEALEQENRRLKEKKE